MKYNDSKYPGSDDYERTRPRLNPPAVRKVEALLSANLTGEVDMTVTLPTTVDDFVLPAGVSFLLHPDPAGSTITGFAGGRAARFVFLQNDGPANITLANQNAGSEESNRTITGTGASVVLQPDRSALLIYNGVRTRWKLVAFT
jgi:hypothetical protein